MTVRTLTLTLAAGLVVLTVAAGCQSSKSESTPSADANAGGGSVATTSQYDSGPRANSVAADHEKAEKGKALFAAKGCSACHGFGQRMTGPDLKGVTARRTEAWLTHWLAAPDEMQKTDPIARQLLAEFPTQMPNLHLTPEEVAQLIDYLRLQDTTLGAAK